MKKLIAIAVLCVASMALGAAADMDLVATVAGDYTTTLTNTGDDPIEVGTLVFADYVTHAISTGAAGGKFAAYIGLAEGTTEIAFVTFGAPVTLAAGESTNIGVIVETSSPWTVAFVDAEPEPVYKFEYIPEPASMSMLALGALALIHRRR